VQPHVNFNLGQVLRRSGDLAGAKEAYEHALRTDPTYGRARNALASMQPKPAAP
jgi:Tfp pilus assembly protein PilF